MKKSNQLSGMPVNTRHQSDVSKTATSLNNLNKYNFLSTPNIKWRTGSLFYSLFISALLLFFSISLYACTGGTSDYVYNGNVNMSTLYSALPSNFKTSSQVYDCASGNNYDAITCPSGVKLIINGNLTIDKDIIFTDLHMIIQEGKYIFVNGGNRLIVQGPTLTILETCGNAVWKGIELTSSTSMLFMLSGNVSSPKIEVRDAYYGVRSKNGAQYIIDGVLFNRNYFGVLVDNQTSSSDGSNNLIASSIFTCANSSGPTTVLGTTVRSYAGVKIESGTGYRVGWDYNKLSSYPSSPSCVKLSDNNFSYQDNGVMAYNTTEMHVMHNQFTNLETYSGSSSNAGVAVYAIGTSTAPATIHIGEANTNGNQTNTFTDCRIGVRLQDYCRINAAYNYFDVPSLTSTAGQYKGIEFNTVNGVYTSYINNNTFHHVKHAVLINSISNANYTLNIDANTFEGKLDVTSGLPITEYGVYSGAGSFYLYVTNNPQISDYRYGVRVHSNNTAVVNFNTIWYNMSSSVSFPANYGYIAGILISNCESFNIINNYVDWPTYPTQTSSNAGYTQGIRLENSTSGGILCNHITGMGTGMYLQNNVKLNNFETNFLKEAYFGFSLSNGEMDAVGNTSYSKYNTFDAITGPQRVHGTLNTSPFDDVDWYYVNSDDYPMPCSYQSGQGSIVVDHLVTLHNECIEGDGGEGRFAIDENKVQILEAAVTNSGSYIYFPTQSEYQSYNFVYKTLSNNPELLSNSIVLQQFYTNHSQSNIGNYWAVVQDIGANDIASALQKLNNITDNNTIESNKKAVLLIYCNKVAAGIEPDNNDIVTLQDIAYTPAIVGGEAVYWARAILHIEVDDEYLLNTQSWKYGSTEENISGLIKPRARAFPNPANDYINLFVEKGNYEITFTDMYGRCLHKTFVEHKGNQLSVSIKDFVKGVYWIKYTSSETKGSEKVVIVK